MTLGCSGRRLGELEGCVADLLDRKFGGPGGEARRGNRADDGPGLRVWRACDLIRTSRSLYRYRGRRPACCTHGRDRCVEAPVRGTPRIWPDTVSRVDLRPLKGHCGAGLVSRSVRRSHGGPSYRLRDQGALGCLVRRLGASLLTRKYCIGSIRLKSPEAIRHSYPSLQITPDLQIDFINSSASSAGRSIITTWPQSIEYVFQPGAFDSRS